MSAEANDRESEPPGGPKREVTAPSPRTLWTIGVVLVCFFLSDAVLPWPASGWSALTRAIWIVVFWSCAMLPEDTRARWERALGLALAAVTALAICLLLALSGGKRGAFFSVLLAVPFAIAAFIPGRADAVALASVIVVALGGAMMTTAGTPVGDCLLWMATAAGASMIAVLSAKQAQRGRDAERAAMAARLAAEKVLRRYENERSRTERLVALGRLASGMSHWINNPLTAVQGGVDYLSEESSSLFDPTTREVVSEMAEATRRITSVMRELREFTGDSGRFSRSGDPAEALERVTSTCAARYPNVRISVENEAVGARVPMSPKHLARALEHLLLNAAEAAQETADPDGPAVSTRITADASALCIRVRDNGPGVAEEIREHLFDPFFSTRGPHRTGLGLAVALAAFSRVGGRLVWLRESSSGTVFEATIPLTPEA